MATYCQQITIDQQFAYNGLRRVLKNCIETIIFAHPSHIYFNALQIQILLPARAVQMGNLYQADAPFRIEADDKTSVRS